MRTIRMTSKKAGTCTECKCAIVPGQSIYWSRGNGARHVDCQSTKYAASRCSSCDGAGALWNNRPCPQCDGTGSAKVAEFARQGREPDVDMMYEDDCARRCGL